MNARDAAGRLADAGEVVRRGLYSPRRAATWAVEDATDAYRYLQVAGTLQTMWRRTADGDAATLSLNLVHRALDRAPAR